MKFYRYRGDGLTVAEEAALEKRRGGRKPGTGAHGKRTRYEAGCRCAKCLTGHEARIAANRQRRRSDAGNPGPSQTYLW